MQYRLIDGDIDRRDITLEILRITIESGDVELIYIHPTSYMLPNRISPEHSAMLRGENRLVFDLAHCKPA